MGGISVIFVGSLKPPFWTSGDIFPGFQIQGGLPSLYALLPVCNGFPKFISGTAPAGLLAASMAAKPFRYRYLRTGISGAPVWDQECCCLLVPFHFLVNNQQHKIDVSVKFYLLRELHLISSDHGSINQKRSILAFFQNNTFLSNWTN